MFLSEEGRLFWDVFIGFMVFLDLLIVPYDAASSISLGHIFGTREGYEESTALSFSQKLTSWVFNDQPCECADVGQSRTIGRAAKIGWEKK